jgi:hypothetical protein
MQGGCIECRTDAAVTESGFGSIVAKKIQKHLVVKKFTVRVNPNRFADYDSRRTGANIFKNGAPVSLARPFGRVMSVKPKQSRIHTHPSLK